MATAVGTAAQGMSVAIVYNAIDKIAGMINTAEGAVQRTVDSEVNAAIRSISPRPDVASIKFKEQYEDAGDALERADLDGRDLRIERLPQLLDMAVGSFFDDYTDRLDALFPGLGVAGEDADAFVRMAFSSAMGVSYNELVDSTPAETAFLLAQQEAYRLEREALAAAAMAGHRFAHGHLLEGLARSSGAAMAGVTEALTQSHAARLSQERSDKMRLARVSMETSMNRVKKLHKQVTEAFLLKMRARGMWIDDQNAVVDSVHNRFKLNERFDLTMSELLRRTSARRLGLKFDAAQAKDRADFLGKLKMANANEVVDLYGNMVTTLMNQVHGKGGYNGTERDVTDWDEFFS